VTGAAARLAHALPWPNQIVLLVREFRLLLIIHYWRVVQFALLVLESRWPAGRQVLRHLAQLRLVCRQSLLLVHKALCIEEYK